MDDATLLRSLRARPPTDPVYRARLIASATVAPRAASGPIPRPALIIAMILAALLIVTAVLIGSRPATTPPRSGTFAPTGSMLAARTQHTATLLPDGRVLVTGGAGLEDEPLATAELYDPSTGTWSAIAPMSHARISHTATLLLDGRVLVAGGPHAAAEIYDPLTSTWDVTEPMDYGRISQTATLLQDGRVLVTGGAGATAELYDPETGTWVPTGSMTDGRLDHTATLLRDGRVLVAGGGELVSRGELYDPATNTWSSTSDLVTPRMGHAAALLADGRVLIAGGSTEPDGLRYSPMAVTEMFDPGTGAWTSAGDLSAARVFPTATTMGDGHVLLTGGYGSEDGSLGDPSTAALLDPAELAWTTTGAMGRPRLHHTATALQDGRVLVAGGTERPSGASKGWLADAELYSP